MRSLMCIIGQDTFISGAVILAYFGTGIACAVYASKWGMTPTLCGAGLQLEEDVCSSIPLTATNALEAVSNFSVWFRLEAC